MDGWMASRELWDTTAHKAFYIVIICGAKDPFDCGIVKVPDKDSHRCYRGRFSINYPDPSGANWMNVWIRLFCSEDRLSIVLLQYCLAKSFIINLSQCRSVSLCSLLYVCSFLCLVYADTICVLYFDSHPLASSFIRPGRLAANSLVYYGTCQSHETISLRNRNV